MSMSFGTPTAPAKGGVEDALDPYGYAERFAAHVPGTKPAPSGWTRPLSGLVFPAGLFYRNGGPCRRADSQ